MSPDQLRDIMEYLRGQVCLKDGAAEGQVAIAFNVPTVEAMVGVGLNLEGCEQILYAPWWDEMVADVVETPEMCDPDDPPEQILEYARDVVSEYIRKRAKL